VPEFQELTYPTPMVDHKFARERCLSTYKEALGKN
jgi:deoxyribodipyrimidine photo-lyase